MGHKQIVYAPTSDEEDLERLLGRTHRRGKHTCGYLYQFMNRTPDLPTRTGDHTVSIRSRHML